MYNRYIPQPDGSYRRSSAESKPKPRPQSEPACPPQEPPKKEPPHKEPPRQEPPRQDNDASGLGFLRQLLPKNLDSGDLIVVLLLILMAGDCQEERSNALLTLALYFIM